MQAEPGLGQARAPMGTLDATGYGKITRGAPVRIRKPDASETSEQIARLFQSQLSVRGFGIASTGMANVLSFRFTSDVSADPKALSDGRAVATRERNPSYHDEATSVLRLGQRGVSEPKGLRSRTPILLVELVDLQGRLLWSARATSRYLQHRGVRADQGGATHSL